MNAKYHLYQKLLIFHNSWGNVEVEVTQITPPGSVFGVPLGYTYKVECYSMRSTDHFDEQSLEKAVSDYRSNSSMARKTNFAVGPVEIGDVVEILAPSIKSTVMQVIILDIPAPGFSPFIEMIEVGSTLRLKLDFFELDQALTAATLHTGNHYLVQRSTGFASSRHSSPSLSAPFSGQNPNYGGDPYKKITADWDQMRRDHVQNLVKGLPPQECNHSYKLYEGFNESYHYCTKCDAKHGSKQ